MSRICYKKIPSFSNNKRVDKIASIIWLLILLSGIAFFIFGLIYTIWGETPEYGEQSIKNGITSDKAVSEFKKNYNETNDTTIIISIKSSGFVNKKGEAEYWRLTTYDLLKEKVIKFRILNNSNNISITSSIPPESYVTDEISKINNSLDSSELSRILYNKSIVRNFTQKYSHVHILRMSCNYSSRFNKTIWNVFLVDNKREECTYMEISFDASSGDILEYGIHSNVKQHTSSIIYFLISIITLTICFIINSIILYKRHFSN